MARSSDNKTYLDCQSSLADTTVAKDSYSPAVHSAGAVRGMPAAGDMYSSWKKRALGKTVRGKVDVNDRGDAVNGLS